MQLGITMKLTESILEDEGMHVQLQVAKMQNEIGGISTHEAV